MTAGQVPAPDADPLTAALDHARRGAGRPPGWDDTLDAAYMCSPVTLLSGVEIERQLTRMIERKP